MNLRDLQRMTEAVFGSCLGCDACDACRAQGLVKMAWETGRRSGARTSSEKKSRNLEWQQWPWTTETPKLIRWAVRSGSFESTTQAEEWIRYELLTAADWAKAKGQKRIDWTAFARSWLRRRMPPPEDPQPDLFAGSSSTSSVASVSQDRRKQARSAAAMRLLKGGKH